MANASATGSFRTVLIAFLGFFWEVSGEYEISFLGKAAIWNSFKSMSVGFCWPPFLYLLVTDCDLICHERDQDGGCWGDRGVYSSYGKGKKIIIDTWKNAVCQRDHVTFMGRSHTVRLDLFWKRKDRECLCNVLKVCIWYTSIQAKKTVEKVSQTFF